MPSLVALARRLTAFGLLALTSCRGFEANEGSLFARGEAHAQAPSTRPVVNAPAESAFPSTAARAVAACASPLPVFEDGREVGRACDAELASAGLTRVDLADTWAPWVFRAREGQPDVPYRRTYVALADERDRDERGRRVDDEPYLELFGIFPTFRVLRARAEDASAHACVATIDPEPLRRFTGSMRRGVQPPEAIAAIATMQKHLACERHLPRYAEGAFDAITSRALAEWQRKNMLVTKGTFDETSRDVMLLPNEERIFRGMLRALRERVVDATGLVEDGTAGEGQGTVLGRTLDAPELYATVARGALPNAAPDQISRATEAAAKALGWADPAKAFAFLRAHDTRALAVAVRLPALPAYHTEHMELRAEIDRGDVRPPGNRPGDRRPTTVLYVRHDGVDVPLARWNTTIGGFQSEVLPDGTLAAMYKESPAGPRIWRDVIVAPSWLPPASTPDSELIVGRGGVRSPNFGVMGPGYRSAYGLLMVMHHKVLPPAPSGAARFEDEGVRSHGSVSYHSILSGTSHGCHRLYNHLALRLGAFLVRHRRHAVRGAQRAEYQRDLFDESGESFHVEIESRGYLYELTPPVDVNVLEGTVHGRIPKDPRPLRGGVQVRPSVLPTPLVSP